MRSRAVSNYLSQLFPQIPNSSEYHSHPGYGINQSAFLLPGSHIYKLLSRYVEVSDPYHAIEVEANCGEVQR